MRYGINPIDWSVITSMSWRILNRTYLWFVKFKKQKQNIYFLLVITLNFKFLQRACLNSFPQIHRGKWQISLHVFSVQVFPCHPFHLPCCRYDIYSFYKGSLSAFIFLIFLLKHIFWDLSPYRPFQKLQDIHLFDFFPPQSDRLFHDSPFLCIAHPWSHLDRWGISLSSSLVCQKSQLKENRF